MSAISRYVLLVLFVLVNLVAFALMGVDTPPEPGFAPAGT